jgi:hypothetical protein
MMQRIDENTYIDDTLVTCAEYQLFIDEMREHGKSYQPDHWRSYQFPRDQALAPILGVRPSDAKAFCEWLSNRDGGKWHYRWPSSEEAARHAYPRGGGDGSRGYWVSAGSDPAAFAWIGRAPLNPRNLKIDDLVDLDQALQALVGSLALQRILRHALDLDFDLGLDLPIDSILDEVLDRSIERDFYLDYYRDVCAVLVLALDSATSSSQALLRDRGRGRSVAVDHDLLVVIDLLTLKMRIEGQSPAFEGIRLIKEWAR